MKYGDVGKWYVDRSAVYHLLHEQMVANEQCRDHRSGRYLERLFLFQAEDGIRYTPVTGVQTCALPISAPRRVVERSAARAGRAHPGRDAREHACSQTG